MVARRNPLTLGPRRRSGTADRETRWWIAATNGQRGVRAEIAALVAGLTQKQLRADLGEGWSVLSHLAHLGFWDRWQAERWRSMLSGSWTADARSILDAEDLANEALAPYWATMRWLTCQRWHWRRPSPLTS